MPLMRLGHRRLLAIGLGAAALAAAGCGGSETTPSGGDAGYQPSGYDQSGYDQYGDSETSDPVADLEEQRRIAEALSTDERSTTAS